MELRIARIKENVTFPSLVFSRFDIFWLKSLTIVGQSGLATTGC